MNSLKRIDKVITEVKKSCICASSDSTTGNVVPLELLQKSMNAFESALLDDVNTPRAVAALFLLINGVEKALKNGGIITQECAIVVNEVFERMDSVLGVVYEVPQAYFKSDVLEAEIPEEMVNLARKRSALKASKMYAEADEVRKQLAAAGYAVKDGKGGEFELIRL